MGWLALFAASHYLPLSFSQPDYIAGTTLLGLVECGWPVLALTRQP